jgi:hypothetical protein
MINLLSIENTYIKNKIYVDTLIKIYPFINLIILNNDADQNKYTNLTKDNENKNDANIIINSLNKFNLLYSNNIILHELTEDFLIQIEENTSNILNKYNNIYILNYENLEFYEPNYFIFLKKYLFKHNIKIINYSFNNKNILDKYLQSSLNDNLYYLPFQIDLTLNNTYLESLKKNNLGVILNSDINKSSNILNHLDADIILLNDMENLTQKLLSYKIIFIDGIIDINQNLSIYYDYIIQTCVLNKIIIIKNNDSDFNPLFKNYVIELPDSVVISFLYHLINNYNDIYEKIYYNTDHESSNFNKIIEHTKSVSDFTIYDIINKNKYGFIMIRHVNSEETNRYWIESYNCIRKYYYNKIIIIDDNSNDEFITKDINLINCYVIKSEFPKRGEILAYYYMYKYNLFDKAVIIHDSVFVNKYIDFFKYDNIKFLWHFTHHWDTPEDELRLLKIIKNNFNLIKLFALKNKWMGCFGLQSVIEYSFLKKINDKYNIFGILDYIDSRPKRMNLERIFALITTYENDVLSTEPSIYGIIHHYIHWGYTYNNYLDDKNDNHQNDNHQNDNHQNDNHQNDNHQNDNHQNDNNNQNKTKKLDLIKVWTGR